VADEALAIAGEDAQEGEAPHHGRGYEEVETEAERGEGRGGNEPAGRAQEGYAGDQRHKRQGEGEEQRAALLAEEGQEAEKSFHAAPVFLPPIGVGINLPPAMRQALSIRPATASE
jgi:hypothetical protein